MNLKLLLISLSLILSSKILAQDVSQAQRNALIDFFNQMDGPNWQTKTNWNTNQLISTWYGVTVQNINGNPSVTGVSLSNNYLTGSIPNSFNNLVDLKSLYLSQNNILDVGTSLQNLVNLEYIDLSNNLLTGNKLMPYNSTWPNLKYIKLSFNNLTDNLSTFFNNKPLLNEFDSQSYGQKQNKFTGYLDFSQNPNLNRINIGAPEYSLSPNFIIKLKNGNNGGLNSVQVLSTVKCIEVNNPTAANNGYQPYSSWGVYSWYNQTVNYQSDCSQFLSTNEIASNPALIIITNPVKDILEIESKYKIIEIKLFDSSGKFLGKIKNNESLGFLPKGIYYIIIQTSKSLTKTKLIKI
jgi:hypothetical protein